MQGSSEQSTASARDNGARRLLSPFIGSRAVAFPELTYANPDHPKFKRWLIRRIEQASGRDDFAESYGVWRNEHWPVSNTPMADMLHLAGIKLSADGAQWPPKHLGDEPLVLIANHPFGIGDGIAIMALAEKLGRPMKILINTELMKVPEIRAYSLPVSFEETKEALKANMKTKRDAEAFLASGGLLVVFPGGGVATAESGFGRASELPWKTFTAKLVQSSKATVLPVFFHGQNGRMFHMASRVSMTLRTSLLIREFRKLSGRTIRVSIGEPISSERLSEFSDRKALLAYLQDRVFSIVKPDVPARRPRHTNSWAERSKARIKRRTRRLLKRHP
ncbi:MAG: lysophospholipid acyltransferase family protein [Pseudomonadota bacterium]